METSLLMQLEAVIPTFLAIMSLVLFTTKTRIFSYSIILLAIGAELIPFSVNTTALFACVFCFIGLLIREYMQTHNLNKQLHLFKISKARHHHR